MRQVGVQRGHPKGHEQPRVQDKRIQGLGDVVVGAGLESGEHVVPGPLGRHSTMYV